MSLDTTQMEVLLRSGTAKEKKCARRIMPLIKNQHHLLVTLLLCNAAAMTASGQPNERAGEGVRHQLRWRGRFLLHVAPMLLYRAAADAAAVPGPPG